MQPVTAYERLCRIFTDLADERDRQDRFKAEGRFPHTCADREMTDGDRLRVLVEELGEAARASLEADGHSNDKHNVDLRAELVQVAEVAVAWIEAIDITEKDL